MDKTVRMVAIVAGVVVVLTVGGLFILKSASGSGQQAIAAPPAQVGTAAAPAPGSVEESQQQALDLEQRNAGGR